MADSPATPDASAQRTVRDIADGYVAALTDLDPILATALGVRPGEDGLPDLSPAGQQAADDLARKTLADLGAVTGELAGDERRCARLLRERLEAGLAMSEQGEHLRAVSNIFGPPHRIRGSFLDMPAASEEDWTAIARRMARVSQALGEYQACLTEGARRGMFAGPRVVRACAEQLEQWAATSEGRGWFADFAAPADVPAALRYELDQAATAANEATFALARWLGTVYLPQASGTQDGVGADRYRVCARLWTGADLDPDEAYAWGWSQFFELQEQMRTEAEQVLPGATAQQAMHHLEENGEAIDGVEEIRTWLQAMMDQAIADLDGTHFDLADPIKDRRGEDRSARQRRRSVLHEPVSGLLPPGAHVAADARPDQVPALGADQHLVSRRRARPSRPASPVAVSVERAIDVPDHRGRGKRMQRGLGAVCRAADG
jgi:uncharacterized protein (DUF885 family)